MTRINLPQRRGGKKQRLDPRRLLPSCAYDAWSEQNVRMREEIAKYLFFGLTERVNTNVDYKIFALRLNATQAVTMARGRMAAGHCVGLRRVASE